MSMYESGYQLGYNLASIITKNFPETFGRDDVLAKRAQEKLFANLSGQQSTGSDTVAQAISPVSGGRTQVAQNETTTASDAATDPVAGGSVPQQMPQPGGGQGQGPMNFRELTRGMTPKEMSALFAPMLSSAQGLKFLMGEGQDSQGRFSLVKGEDVAASLPGSPDMKGYVFQRDPESGKLSTLISPERPFSVSPGSYLYTADGQQITKAPENLKIQSVSEGGSLVLVNPNDKTATQIYSRPPGAPDINVQSHAYQVEGRDPNTGETVTREVFQPTYSTKQGAYQVGAPQVVSESRKPMQMADAARVTAAREGIRITDELRNLVLKTDKSTGETEVNRAALVSAKLGLPGVVAPEGAQIAPKVLQAIDPYVRITTGAQLNEQEVKNAQIMFTPGAGDSKAVIEDKFNRLQRFLSGDLSLMGMIADPGSPLSNYVHSQSAQTAGQSGAAPAESGQGTPGAPPAGAGKPGAASTRPTQVTSKAEYDALPSGATFTFTYPDGRTRTGRKP